ncbi:MAG TPA: MBL fold metallo-hydrolase [Solirubrobacteraceae bacterium]
MPLESLVILGSGGWFPAHNRHTACALLRNGNSAILIDAGTGAGRLVENPALLDGVERLDILLTHFHLDHVSGLAYLPAIGLIPDATVWGPGATLYGLPTATLLAPLSNEPFHPVSLEKQEIEVRDLPAGEFELAGTRIETRRQDRHSAPTLGLRFGDALGWITDTAYDPDTAAFVQGVGTLAHEAWFTSDAPLNEDVHSSAAQAADVAAEAEVDRLLLIHLPPLRQDVVGLAIEAQSIVPRSLLAEDGCDVSSLLV